MKNPKIEIEINNNKIFCFLLVKEKKPKIKVLEKRITGKINNIINNAIFSGSIICIKFPCKYKKKLRPINIMKFPIIVIINETIDITNDFANTILLIVTGVDNILS